MVAVVFLAVSGVMMLSLAMDTRRAVYDTRDAVLVNLRNTCYNSEQFRSHEQVVMTCWSEYVKLGGKAP